MRGHAHHLALVSIIVATALGIAASRASGQAADPAVGTWTLNVAKSTYKPGPAPKSLSVKIEAAGQGIKSTSDGVNADGSKTHSEYTANYDGKDYPLNGMADADTVSLKRMDANTTERTDKKAGKVVRTYTRKVAADGKTMTATIKGTDEKGRAIDNTVVLERK
jgi:hypothetical protein